MVRRLKSVVTDKSPSAVLSKKTKRLVRSIEQLEEDAKEARKLLIETQGRHSKAANEEWSEAQAVVFHFERALEAVKRSRWHTGNRNR